MPTTNLSDRWSREADRLAAEPPVTQRAVANGSRSTHHASREDPRLPALTRLDLQKLAAAGLISGPGLTAALDKSGGRLAAKIEGVHTFWMRITPDLAARWLTHNFGNRPVKEDVVAGYARDMRGGRWKRTHQGIAFNDRDQLIDGQHRLLAVRASGVTIECQVTFGLPARTGDDPMTTMDAVDRGAPRTVGDQLKIQHGIREGRQVAILAATIAGICAGEKTRRVGVGQTLDVYHAWQKELDWVIAHRAKTKGLRQAGVLAGFAFALPALGEQGRSWYQALNAQSPELPRALGELLNFLTSDEARLLARSSARGVAELTLQALWLDHHRRPDQLAVVTAGADWFRAQQAERVAKIAKLFVA